MRNNVCKKITTILMASFVFVATLSFSTPVSATTNNVSLVALGDSITTGYGLPGYTPPTLTSQAYASDSFVEVLKITQNFTTANFAIDGLTASQLAMASNPQIMNPMQKVALQNATMISITIGGNDLLGAFYAAMGAQMGITNVDATTMPIIQAAIIAGASGAPGTQAQGLMLMKAIMQVAGSMNNIAAAFAQDLTTIVMNVKRVNPTAKIVIQTIANPYKDLPNESLVAALDSGVSALNTIITSGSIVGGYQVVDVYTAFKSSSEILTNATNPSMPLDPHPNAAGHKVIANLMAEEVGHSYTDWEIIIAPTCVTPGLQRRVCTTCGSVEEQELPATGHDWMEEFTIDEVATCTKEGVKSIHCPNCDEVKDRTVIPMIEHTMSDWIVDKEATQHEEGLRHRECSVCKEVLEEESIARLIKQNSFVDSTTGIKVGSADESFFDINMKLTITTMTKEKMDTYNERIQNIAKGYSLLSLYDISLMDGEKTVQPSGKLTISIPLTEAMKSMKDLKVIFVDENSNVEIIPHEIVEGNLVFTTDHLSMYGVIGKETKGTTSPQTSDATKSVAFILFGLVSAGFLVVLTKKKKAL